VRVRVRVRVRVCARVGVCVMCLFVCLCVSSHIRRMSDFIQRQTKIKKLYSLKNYARESKSDLVE
jgi:hypothetical protein